MKKTFFGLILLGIFGTSCAMGAPSDETISTIITQEQASPTPTTLPTDTHTPTLLPSNTPVILYLPPEAYDNLQVESITYKDQDGSKVYTSPNGYTTITIRGTRTTFTSASLTTDILDKSGEFAIYLKYFLAAFFTEYYEFHTAGEWFLGELTNSISYVTSVRTSEISFGSILLQFEYDFPKITLTASPSSSTKRSCEVMIYIVKEGDTISGIATLYGVSVEDILEYNPTISGMVLFVGQELFIPLCKGMKVNTVTP